MTISRAATVFVVLLPVLVVAQTRSEARDPLKGLDEFIKAGMQDTKLPGFAVAIVKDDSVILTKGYGTREYGHVAPVDEHTIFPIGSTTKALTATALGMLVDEGKLNWDDRIIDHLPSFQLYDPWVTRHTTIRDALTHRSDTNPDLLSSVTILTRDEIIDRLRFVKPDGPFRARFSYNNVMYTVAGQVLGAAAGMSWDEFVRQRIFAPLGMKESYTNLDALWDRSNIAPCFTCDLSHSVHTEDARNHGNVSLGHMMTAGGPTAIAPRRYDNIGPAGGELSSSAHDMAQWLKLQVGNGVFNGVRLVRSKSMEEAHSPQNILPAETDYFPRNGMTPIAYGFGWFLYDYNGTRIVWHSGGVLGFRALVGLLPEKHVGVAILTNCFMAPLAPALMMRIFDAYLGLPERNWGEQDLEPNHRIEQKARELENSLQAARVKGTHPSLPLERYAGTYESPMYGRVSVTVENGGLVLRFPGAQVADLEHWHYDIFRMRLRGPLDAGVFVTFSMNLRGEVAEMALDYTPTVVITPPSETTDRLRRLPDPVRSDSK